MKLKMKHILAIILLALLSVNSNAQWFTVNNVSGTTATYGTNAVSVLGGGTFSTYPGWCGAGNYWIGDGTGGTPNPGWYTYTFSPAATSVRIYSTASDPGESIAISINGIRYHLTLANLVGWPSTCGTPVMTLSGDTLLSIGGNSSAELKITNCPINSIEVETDGLENGTVFTFMFSDSGSCFRAWNNGPCIGDTLFLNAFGDSIGATYAWTGPGGFTSTLKNPFIFPSVFADSGIYTVIWTIGTGLDTSVTDVVIHPLPVINASSNAPLCAGLVDTLKLISAPDSLGETFAWTGPNGFTSSLENPTIPGFSAADTGVYTVIATTRFGCVSTTNTEVGLVPPPPAPLISGVTSYCQGAPFVPFTLSGLTGAALWYTTRTGGVGSTTALTISTAIPGLYKVWASQIIGSCESPRDSIAVRITTTPLAPRVTGTMQYCQYIGTFTPLTVTTTSTGVALWYLAATGGSSSNTEPVVNINIAGTYNSWVSQIDSSCEGPRTPVTIVVHPKPSQPVVTIQGPYCQFAYTPPVIATASGAGDFLTWFGAGIPVSGTLLTPIPQSNTAGLDSFYVNETTIYGCISDKALDTVRITPKPQAPVTRDTTYCQNAVAVPLNYETDSAGRGGGGHLNWYFSATLIPTPVPSTTTPGQMTWYVSQTVNNCQSDSSALTVTTIYLPKFVITPSSPWVCEYDSLTFAYNGPALQAAGYLWTLPVGDSFTSGSTKTDSMIMVKFDSASKYTRVILKASDNNSKCFTFDTVLIKVVAQPTAAPYTKGDVCLGDTTSLTIDVKSEDANNYQWYIDYLTLLGNSSALNVISSGSNSGGPFSISWLDTGRHVIQLNSFTQEGCASKPYFDTVNVHAQPDASFDFTYNQTSLCLEDSVYFTASGFNYNNSYEWSPAHSFTNINKPTAWGKLEQGQSIITLTVSNPFGCMATTSKELEVGSCCTVAFPNAFTPNGDGHDDYFRPLYTGYHNFHEFRIQNRWGQTIFESTNSNLKWDGTFNGVPQDMGVYFYYLKYDCGGRTIEETGDVTLIR